MAINGISNLGGFYGSNIARNIPKVDLETVKQQDAAKKQAELNPLEQFAGKETTTPVVNDNRTRTADLDNISLNFNSGDDYSYIGSDFALDNLDMEKAISDMKKDKMLADYQYFVGSSENLNELFNGSDGKVLIKY